MILLATLCLLHDSSRGQSEPTAPTLSSCAQLDRVIASGTLVKVKLAGTAKTTPGSSSVLVGKWGTCRESTLFIFSATPGGDVHRIPLRDIKALYVNDGHSSLTWPGAIVGLLVGVVAGCAIANATYDAQGWAGLDQIENKIYTGTAITLFGTAIGAAIGATLGSDSWARVYDQKHGLAVGSGPAGERRMTVALSF